MKASAKWLLTLALTGLGGGLFLIWSGAKAAPAWAVLLPLGAICWGMFLITLLLQKEVASFDAEERWKIESAGRNRACAAEQGKSPTASEINASMAGPTGMGSVPPSLAK